ncbi:ABC transporter permease [Flavitalea flava]
MFSNYIKPALRHLKKEGSTTGINIFGLGLGLAVCLLITLFITDEYSYDRYNEKAGRIFRVVSDIHINGNSLTTIYGPSPLAPALAKDYPQIEKAVRIRYMGVGELTIRSGSEKIMESNAVFTDPSFFEVFTIPLIVGDQNTALLEPYSMVISENIAKKYFNSLDVLGKILVTGDSTIYKITGVIREMPAQSHFHFHFIRSMSEYTFKGGLQWVNFFSSTYLLTKPGITTRDLDKMLTATVIKYVGPQLQNEMHSSLADLAKNGDYYRFYVMPLTDIHLHSNFKGEFESNGSLQSVYIFLVIAVLILLIACFNFVNLSTARSVGRSREVGVRKILGSSRRDLICRFLAESLLTSFAAMLLAVLIALVLLPYFNQLSGKQMTLMVLGKRGILFGLLPAALLVGLLAGTYPAFFLSAFQPVLVLKGRLATGFTNNWLRNCLVVFQFATAIFLIICTLGIYNQLNYIRNKDLGFNRDQVLTIKNTSGLGPQARLFKKEVEKLPGITGGTMTEFLPGRVYDGSRGYFKNASAVADQTYLLGSWKIDADYIPTLGMKILEGRNFSPSLPTDSSCVLINETAARILGYKDPLHESIYTGPDQVVRYPIVGVVKDFNGGTPRDKIEPIVFHLAENTRAISFKINQDKIQGLLPKIKGLYQSTGTAGGQPFIYSFMDDDFNKLYQSDRRTGKLFLSFAFFAIFLACLGLFGLATYAAEQRIKEIGIRKVLGATVGQLVVLLAKDFLKLVILAAIIACPLAWWGMHRWLQDFAYRSAVGWLIFVLSVGSAVLITFLTISYRTFQTARANPVISLRESA